MKRKLVWIGSGIVVLVVLVLLAWQALRSGAGPGGERQVRRKLPPEAAGQGLEKRLALVIGNSAYRHIGPLANPGHDARAVAAALQQIGFELVDGQALVDLSLPEMRKAMGRFGEELKGKQVGLFYYAGHGMQLKGRNYLIPVSAEIRNEDDIEYESLPLDRVLEKMDLAKSRVNLVVLDACRNNPYTARGFRSVNAGLAKMEAPEGTFIAYATQAGQVAEDGKGRHSPFSGVLSQAIVQPGLSLDEVFNEVSREVKRTTDGKQRPWVAKDLSETVYLAGAPGRKPEGGRPSSTHDAEDLYWQSIMSSQDRADFEAYLRNYPRGKYADLARNKIKRLPLALAPVKIDDKWGYIDRTGRVVLKPTFEDAGIFSKGLAEVKNSGKWGLIDGTGKVVLNQEYEYIGVFSDGLAVIVSNGRLGYVDKTGKVVVEPRFDPIHEYSMPGYGKFHEGMAVVRSGGKYGVIDNTGRMVVEPKFNNVLRFREGMAGVRISGDRDMPKWGAIDKTGRMVVEAKFEEVLIFSEGLSIAVINNKWGFIDKTGRMVVEPKYDFAYHFREGMAHVRINGKPCYINKNGKVVIELDSNYKYMYLDGRFYEGLAKVNSHDDKYGFIDITGKVIFKPHVEEAENFHDGLAKVKSYDYGVDETSKTGLGFVKYNGYGFINRNGNIVVNLRFEALSDFKDGLACAKIGGKWGFIDKTGKMVVDARFDQVGMFSEGMAVVKSSGKWGYIDRTGEWVIPPRFDDARSFTKVE